MRIIYLSLSISMLLICGCNKDVKTLDEREERDPLVKQGQAYMEIKDYDKAEEAFKSAIGNKPMMARPYLDLAIIYHQYKPDYINSIFYYRRYLELRPESEKKKYINEQIQKVHVALANAILTQSGAVQKIQELKQLQAENQQLKQQLAKYQTVQPKVSAPVVETKKETVAKTGAVEAGTNTGHQIYHVIAGDTLSKIAAKFYQDSGKWDSIYQANKDRMKSPGDLRVGQTLVIPSSEN